MSTRSRFALGLLSLLLICIFLSYTFLKDNTVAAQEAEQVVPVEGADTLEKAEENTAFAVAGTPVEEAPIKPATAEAILARQQVPVLCYHQLRSWNASDSKMAKTYIVETENFKNQIKMLADSGFHTILPDQYYDYLSKGTPLPEKPIMLTFDDTKLDQFTVAAPELEKYGFKGVFFVMTVSLGRPNYMSREQVKALSDAGHVIGSHTWDHHNVKKYEGDDWVKQVEKPSKELEQITGKPIEYFAYPFGLWNAKAIPELKQRQMKAAFQLAERRDQQDPLYTIRRIIASGYWSPKQLHNSIARSF